jgi:hypothetical protein
MSIGPPPFTSPVAPAKSRKQQNDAYNFHRRGFGEGLFLFLGSRLPTVSGTMTHIYIFGYSHCRRPA